MVIYGNAGKEGLWGKNANMQIPVSSCHYPPHIRNKSAEHMLCAFV